MKGYSHFRTQSGKASVVSAPPYHYGADFITVYFNAEPEKMQKFLPEGLSVGDGSGVAYICDFVCTVSEHDMEALHEDPAQCTYKEAAVGIRCSYKGNPGMYYPFMWIDRDWSLVRGWSLGYPKKIADDIHMTKLHKFIPRVPYYGPGVKISGYCARHGDRMLSVELEIERKGTVKDLASSPSVYALRHFPVSSTGQSIVNELVEIEKGNAQVGEEIWYGKGNVKFGRSRNEELELIEPVEPTYGLSYQAGFTNYGAKVLQRFEN